jgi:hypothetical protein
MFRRLLLLASLAAGAAVAAAPHALAAVPPCAPAQPAALSSAHFTVTFNDDPANANVGPVETSSVAGSVLAQAEQDYAAFAALGYPAPLTSGGKTQIHIVDLSSYQLSSWNCPGDINLDASALTDPQGPGYTIAFDVFEEVEYTYGSIDGWLAQGLASWAAWKSLGYPEASTAVLGPYDMSLDCQYTSSTSQTCATDGYTNLGASRWPFYEYLTERFGTGFVPTLLADAAVAPNTLSGLQTALASKGTDLATEYGAFTTKLLAGGWSAQQLNLATVPVTGNPILTGTKTADIPAQTFGVDHLATRFVEIDRGDAKAPAHCYAATLTLNVSLPAGVTSSPVFYWAQAGSTPLPLAVSGGSATASIPWDTCSWKIHGYLSLPNTSTSVNGALFAVSGHLDVSGTEVTSTPPSVPASTYGNAVDVGSGAVAPTISVFGPLLVTLPAQATQLELIVASNAEGAVHGTLGGTDLGRRTLTPGENVVRFALPKGTLRRLRSSSALANVLTLSPVSADGTATGKALAVKVVVAPSRLHRAKPKRKQ